MHALLRGVRGASIATVMIAVRREGNKIDYISDMLAQLPTRRTSPRATAAGADAICEKPLVLNPWNIDAIAEMEHAANQGAR